MAKYIDKLLKNTLLELMEDKKLDDITVIILIQCAEINRKTFYNHYRGMGDLVCRILTDECREAVGSNVETDNWNIGVERLMLAIRRNKVLLDRIMESRYAIAAKESIIVTFDEAIANFVQSAVDTYEKRQGCKFSLTRRQRHYLTRYYSSVLLTTLEEWFENEMQESIEECVRFIEILTNNGIYEGIRFFSATE